MGSYRINIRPDLCTEISGLASDDITSAVAKWIRVWEDMRQEELPLFHEGRLYVGDCNLKGISIWTDETDEKKLISNWRMLIANAELALRIVYEDKFVAVGELGGRPGPVLTRMSLEQRAIRDADAILEQLRESKCWSVELLRDDGGICVMV